MTVPFRIEGNAAMLEVAVNGFKVLVSVVSPHGPAITIQDAEVILTNAIPHFPQRIRSPEPLNRRER
jgi:hypothetical protein